MEDQPEQGPVLPVDDQAGPQLPLDQTVNDEEEEDVGPVMPKLKKRKVLEFEEQYLQGLPLSQMYEKSYMHRDTVVQVAVAHGTDFIITASVDGHIKFWKKQTQGIEFAKHYKAHLGPITGLSVSSDGSLCASISTDKTVKVGLGATCLQASHRSKKSLELALSLIHVLPFIYRCICCRCLTLQLLT